jgi:hypothetical protein
MKITKANVEAHAKQLGYEPLQEDGFPDGFVWRESSFIINGKELGRRVVRFKPMVDWQDKDSITYGKE